MSTIHGIQIPSEDEIREIESTGRCVINRQFTLPWFHTKQAPPPVGHIYSEIGQREIFPVVDDNGFDDVSLQSHSESGSNGSVSTAYRVPSKYTVEHSGTQWNKVDSEKNTTLSTPLATIDTSDIVKVPTSKSKGVIRIREIILTVILVSIALILISTIMTIRSLRASKTIPGTTNMAAKADYLQHYIEDKTPSVSRTSVSTPSVSRISVFTPSVSTPSVSRTSAPTTSVSTTSASTTSVSPTSSIYTTPVTTMTSTQDHPTTTLPITTKSPIMRTRSTKKWYRW